MPQAEPNPSNARTSQIPKLAPSAQEVARLLGISRAHVWRMHSSGRLPKPVRLGRAVRWGRAEIEGWLAAGAPTRERWEAMWREKK